MGADEADKANGADAAAVADAERNEPEPEPPNGPPGNGERVPATLYDRWLSAFYVDGVAFGKRVRKRRERSGWTQKDLQERTGVPIATISELESGHTQRPRPALSMTLAQAFGAETPAALLGLPEAPRPPGAHPDGPRTAGGPPPGPGPLTLEALVTGLLRGVWAAQHGQPPPGAGAAPLAAELREIAAQAGAAGEAQAAAQGPGGGGGPVVNLNLIMLVQPRTVG